MIYPCKACFIKQSRPESDSANGRANLVNPFMKRIIFSNAAAAALLVACCGGGSELASNTTAAPAPASTSASSSASSNVPIAAPVATSAPVVVPVATAAVVPSTPVAAPVSTPVAAPAAIPANNPAATPVAAPVAAPVATPAPPLTAATQPVPVAVPVAPPAAIGVVTAENSCALPNFQASVLLAVNAARAQARTCGNLASPAVAALGWNQALMTAATSHSLDMAKRNYFSHTSPEGATTAERAQLAGYPYVALGENIAAGQLGVENVMKAWLGSPGHCLNIMSASYAEIAVACVSAAQAQYPTYWTMVLGKRP